MRLRHFGDIQGLSIIPSFHVRYICRVSMALLKKRERRYFYFRNAVFFLGTLWKRERRH